MRLRMPYPQGARRLVAGTDDVVELRQGVILTVKAPGDLPLDARPWQDAAIREGAGGEIEVRLREETQTHAGWPLTVITSDVLRDGAVIERRIHSFYAFLEHGAVAVVRASPAALPAPGELMGLLRGGAPDWAARETVVSLPELWFGFEGQKIPT